MNVPTSPESLKQLNLLYIADLIRLHDIQIDKSKFPSLTPSIFQWVEPLIFLYEYYRSECPARIAPQDYRITYGYMGTDPVTASLLELIAILPEKAQDVLDLSISRDHLEVSDNVKSWIEAPQIDLLVLVAAQKYQQDGNTYNPYFFYGHHIANGHNVEMDRRYANNSRFEEFYQLSMDGITSEAIWNPKSMFTFPPLTQRIILPWNYTKEYWCAINIDVNAFAWTFTMYNPISSREDSLTAYSIKSQMPLLQKLICRASNIVEPANAPRFFTMRDTAKLAPRLTGTMRDVVNLGLARAETGPQTAAQIFELFTNPDRIVPADADLRWRLIQNVIEQIELYQRSLEDEEMSGM